MAKLLSDSSSSVGRRIKPFPEKLIFQIQLLLWKRWKESTKSKWDLLKVILPAILFFVLIILIYEVFSFFYPDGIEAFFAPLAFWIFMQRLVVQIMYEKSNRLQESMRMMGLSDAAYWLSYFISDGVILGFVLSFICCIFTVGGLFNDANFGVLLGMFFIFCLSAVPFCFFITAFFDTPQTSGQALLGILLGLYVVYIVVFMVGLYEGSYHAAQTVACLVPPLALQIACGAFLNSYTGISISKICSIMFADIFLYGFLAWYFAQVWPSKVGVPKPFYFIFMPSYWFPKSYTVKIDEVESSLATAMVQAGNLEEGVISDKVPEENVNEGLLGAPTVVINKLRKSFGSQLAVNNLSFKMYANQIFALLGHNGAGKTTTISMLTGLTSPDYATDDSGAFVYGSNVLTDMEQIRLSMGVCPQHDVLFDNLTVREHILFFSQLKGYTYEEADADAVKLTELFHLETRLDHTGHELSGGQKRKLSVAIAVCGGSEFVVLDEPTAGMDPLARRELWDLLASLRKGRTMLLTTHYMDEADILGDRVGIMSLGKMQCVGSTQFLKTTYGAGYKLVFDKDEKNSNDKLASLTSFVHSYIPEAKYIVEDGAENQILYSLPFDSVTKFGPFFSKLETCLNQFGVTNFGINITSLEDVFLKVGEDHTVTPKEIDGNYGIGNSSYQFNFISQVIGLTKRRLWYAANDFVTVPMILLPVAVGIAAAVLYNKKVISNQDYINDLVISGMYLGAYLGAPGLIAEFIVKERGDKLRNVLTVMGCDFRAYWLGTFIADYIIMFIPTFIIWISWAAADMPDFYSSRNGLCFFLTLMFNCQLVAFSYFFSFVFNSPKSCISLMPIIIIILLITPNIVLLIGIEIIQAAGKTVSASVVNGVLLWGIMLLTPQGALFSAFLDTTQDYSAYISTFPPVGATIAFMIVESALYLGYSYYVDSFTVASILPGQDPNFNPACLENLDQDVSDERTHALDLASQNNPLVINRLRKVFQPKRQGQRPVVATEDIAFTVESGEIFGLLGANGAGKTTTLSMLTRHLIPDAGDAFVSKYSILTDFSKGATHLGVVTQNNSLWDRLSVEAHLKLFARLRGVPENLVKKVVDTTIDQLELTPHRHKLSMRLSGGMKRKLCVAIALIGDPEVVLLDEPSAGLDPVSRRNLWSVILRTMSHRAVILTTHSMDEAEALCKRIGIMVKGQLRALGTKQHLKNKFGSGFELTVKLTVTNFAEQLAVLTGFVQHLFPSAFVLAENGGLVTYQIPREEMKMGMAFTALEENKQKLAIEDYTIAQPTLEQVFIRTVNKYADKKDTTAGIVTTIGGSAKMSVEGTGLIADEDNDDPSRPSMIEGAFEAVAVAEEKNKCGCTNFCVKVMIAVFAALVVLFVGISFGIGPSRTSGYLFTLAIICLIVSIVGCNILYCACCQQPKDVE